MFNSRFQPGTLPRPSVCSPKVEDADAESVGGRWSQFAKHRGVAHNCVSSKYPAPRKKALKTFQDCPTASFPRFVPYVHTEKPKLIALSCTEFLKLPHKASGMMFTVRKRKKKQKKGIHSSDIGRGSPVQNSKIKTRRTEGDSSLFRNNPIIWNGLGL